MSGMHIAIPKEETNNCYGGAERRVVVNSMAVDNTFILKMKCVSAVCLFIPLSISR